MFKPYLFVCPSWQWIVVDCRTQIEPIEVQRDHPQSIGLNTIIICWASAIPDTRKVKFFPYQFSPQTFLIHQLLICLRVKVYKRIRMECNLKFALFLIMYIQTSASSVA
jgi:hypothetical protein